MRRRKLVHLAFKATLLIAAAIAGLSAFVYSGIYNISALEQHTPTVYRLLQFAMERSVAARSDVQVPELADYDWQASGVLLYEDNCRRCHGAPGVAPDDFSLGMVPAPTAIVQVARKREPEAIHWVIRRGIKMSGMPAWEYRMTEEEMWQVVALIVQIPDMTSSAYAEYLSEARESPAAGDEHLSPEDNSELAERGKVALQQYNCVSCHSIPGVTAGRNHVGPPLGGITERAFIAGVLEFSEENFVKWVRFPQQVDPDTAMPNLGVTEAHAWQMLAYLRSVDSE